MYQKSIIVGTLGRDAEVKVVGNHKVANLSVATNKNRKKGEEWVSETEWHQVTVWAKSDSTHLEKFKKGNLVLVEGEIKTEEYEKEGQKRSVKKIVASVLRNLTPKEKTGDQVQDAEVVEEDSESLPF